MKKGKYASPRRRRGGLTWVLLAVIVLLVGFLAYMIGNPPAQELPDPTAAPEETAAAQPGEDIRIAFGEQAPINLGYGLEITDAGKYTGAYMEDGTDEVVSGTMMILVRNSGSNDIQYARITAVCQGTEYNFTLSNLPAGEGVVLLDQDRKAAVGSAVDSAVLSGAVLFDAPMSLMEESVEIQGTDGVLEVKNISGEDISGDIYVYYKYSAADLFYGGITFRARVEGGLKAGEQRQISTGHYSPGGCRIVQVTVNG